MCTYLKLKCNSYPRNYKIQCWLKCGYLLVCALISVRILDSMTNIMIAFLVEMV